MVLQASGRSWLSAATAASLLLVWKVGGRGQGIGAASLSCYLLCGLRCPEQALSLDVWCSLVVVFVPFASACPKHT